MNIVILDPIQRKKFCSAHIRYFVLNKHNIAQGFLLCNGDHIYLKEKNGAKVTSLLMSQNHRFKKRMSFNILCRSMDIIRSFYIKISSILFNEKQTYAITLTQNIFVPLATR